MSEKQHYNFRYIEDRVRFEHDIEKKLILEFIEDLESTQTTQDIHQKWEDRL